MPKQFHSGTVLENGATLEGGAVFFCGGGSAVSQENPGPPGEPNWLPRRPPLNTEVWLPPESHFGSSSFICAVDMCMVCKGVMFYGIQRPLWVRPGF